MHVLVSCKNEEVSIKNEGTRVVTIFPPLKAYEDFFRAQGQLPLQSMVGSGRISNSSKTLWLILLPAKIKKILS